MSRGLRAGASAAALAALLGAGAAARADTPVRLVWVRGEGAEGCASARELEGHVSARLGKSPFVDGAARSVEGFVRREAGRWSAHLSVRDDQGKLTGSRDLESDAPDCAPLDEAVTLAVALAIDPEAALRPPPSAQAPASVAAPAPPLPPPAPACPPAAPAASAAPTGEASVTARATLTAGLVPGAAAGAAVGSDVHLGGALHLTAGALYLPESRTSGGDFAFGLTAFSAGVCGELWRGAPAELSLCGGVLGGSIHAVVFTLLPTTPGDRLWAGASTSLRLGARLAGPLRAELGLEAVAPLVRYRFRVEGRAEPVYQESAVAEIAYLGMGLSFF